MKLLLNRNFSRSLLALLLGTIMALLIGEVGARFYFFGEHALSYNRVNSFDNFFNSGIAKKSDKNLPYEIRSNLDTYYTLCKFNSNSDGFRDQEFTINHSAKTKNIAIVGDSFTMGQGVEQDEIFHTIAEKKLNGSTDSMKYHLMNFGVSGYNLKEYQVVVENITIKYPLEEIVIGFCGYNDHLLPAEFPIPDFSKLLSSNGFWKSYLWWLIKLRTKPNPDVSTIKYEKDNLTFIEEKLGKINTIAMTRNINVSLIYLATNSKPREADQIKQICLRKGIQFIDASKQFPITPNSNFILNEIDGHPNDKAHSIFATELVHLLKH